MSDYKMIIYNRNEVKVTNTDHLPKGLMCNFLEVVITHIPNEYAAVQWHRISPVTLPEGRALVVFSN